MVEVLETLIEDEYDHLYSVAFRMIGNHQDTQDVLQDSFLKAFKNLNQFRTEAKLSTWVYRIIINECKRFYSKINELPITAITHKEGITEDVFFDKLKTIPEFDDELIIDEMREKCLQGFLKCMPQKHRAAFLLKSQTSFSIEEISTILEISPGNVKVCIYRAKEKMKEMFEERCSLINPNKPCNCYLWVNYAKEHGMNIPTISYQDKNKALKTEHFKNLDQLSKINYLYNVAPIKDKNEFLQGLKNLSQML